MTTLGVNIDHIANVREARKTTEPDPVTMALLAEIGGADCITVHLREDRRHIQDRDLRLLKETIQSKLNMEMAATKEMSEIALQTMPNMVTLVPERREEVTTEGGLNIVANKLNLENVVQRIQSAGIPVSLFIDPSPEQIEAAKDIKCSTIELHTGSYANSKSKKRIIELVKLKEAAQIANCLGLNVNAGHGLNYQNVEQVAAIDNMQELNIGHTIVARAIAVGLKEAVREMKELIKNPRRNLL